jgi:hypothetical protein
MVLRNIGIIVLGLGAMAGMARASVTYQASQSSFASQATTGDGLTLSSLITFTGGLTEVGGVANDAYLDPTTGVEFLAFNGSGSGHVAFASASGGILNTVSGLGDAIEVVFPSGIDYGFAFNFTTTSSFETVCVDTSPATFGNCASNGTTITSGNSGFIGALNDNPTLAPLVSLWIHPQSGAPDTDLQSFEIGTQADAPPAVPETRTMLLIGSGLILIHQLRRRQKKNGTALPQAADRFA